MQSQINNNTPVHVKIALNGEFRRFLLNPLTFATLETTVKTLFTISAPVSLKFQDDEKDWVHLTTDAELLYAIELAGSPLRVDVKILAEVPTLGQTPTVHEEAVQEGCWRGRGGRRGRGGCGGRGGHNVAERLERLEMTETRVRNRIAELQEKLDSGKLTSERERTVGWKITRLQEKLEFVAAKRAGLASAKSENPTEEKSCEETVHETPQEEKWGRRGGRGCRGRRGGFGGEEGCWAKPKGGLMKRLSPEIHENFHQCKTAWKAAKDSGDAEQIAACKEAFWAAKDAKRAAMAALRAQDAGEVQEIKAEGSQ